MYDYAFNSILVHTIPTRTKRQLTLVYKACVEKVKSRGLTPKLHTLDNETSNKLQEFMAQEHIAYQFTPAGIHQRNLAERNSPNVQKPFHRWFKFVTARIFNEPLGSTFAPSRNHVKSSQTLKN